MQNRAEVIEKIAEGLEKAQGLDDSGVDYSDFEDDPESYYGEDEAPEAAPEPELHPFEQRQKTLESIADRVELERAKEIIRDAEIAEEELAEARERVDDEEYERLSKKVDEEDQAAENLVNDFEDINYKLEEDGLRGRDDINYHMAHIRANASGKPLEDYRTWKSAVVEQAERDRLVRENPGEAYPMRLQDERMRIEAQAQWDQDAEIARQDQEKVVDETLISEVPQAAFEDWLLSEFPLIAEDAVLRQQALEVRNNLYATGSPRTVLTEKQALEIVDERVRARNAIAHMAITRGQTWM